MEYIIYCDESVAKGKYFSDFYGGALVRSTDLVEIIQALNAKKKELHLFNEIKWVKVTENYLDKYKQVMDLFFRFIAQDKVKIRIMFRQNAQVPIHIGEQQKDHKFHMLYYQFVKHAFGLRYHQAKPDNRTYVRLYFDKLPDTELKNEEFKSFIYGLQSLDIFRQAKIKIRREDIVEIDSRDHVILQCMDIVLGAVAFRLNDGHKEKPEGATRRGKKTIAKEKLYKHIQHHIQQIKPNFNIGISTGKPNWTELWSDSYRHWLFTPKEFSEDKSKYKK